MSPSRSQGQEFDPLSEPFNLEFENLDRRLSATPPIGRVDAEDEPGSGYDGDQEDVSDGWFIIVCFEQKKSIVGKKKNSLYSN